MHLEDAALIHIRIDVRIERRIEEKNKLNICKLLVANEISIRRNLINRVKRSRSNLATLLALPLRALTAKHAELGPATW